MYQRKMFIVSIIFWAFAISTAKCLRDCEDCVHPKDCASAYEKILHNWNNKLQSRLNNAKCTTGDVLRICCSDFSDENRLKKKKEIEDHPNKYLLPDGCGESYSDRIIGGETADLNEFPWLVLLEKQKPGGKDFHCSGSLINSRYVLTAAHCLQNLTISRVRVGEYDLSTSRGCYGLRNFQKCESDVQDIPVTHKIIHPNYLAKSTYSVPVNDIGLLRLARPVDLTAPNAGVICLPLSRKLRERSLPGEMGIVAGWGWTEENANRLSNILLRTDVPITMPEICAALFLRNRYNSNNNIFANILCADEEGHGSCRGDSGAPLIVLDEDTINYVQFGIVSYGIGCGNGKPSIYTDVTKYMRWILDTIKP